MDDLNRALAARAEVEYEAAFEAAVPVQIRGATGVNAARINGVYDHTAERRRGAVVYRKRGDGATWLSMTAMGWMVQSTEHKEADNTCSALRCLLARDLARAPSPLQVPLAAWEVLAGPGGWEQQASFRIEPA